MNSALIGFVQHLYDHSQSLSVATHAILAVQKRLPRFRGHLKPAWDSIASWKLQEPLNMRVPLPYPVLLAMVLTCFSRGFISHRKKAFEWIALGVGLLTGFTGLLRPGELCGAQRGHLTVPSDAVFAFGHKAILPVDSTYS